MSEMVTASEYAAWLAVMVERQCVLPTPEVGGNCDSRPDLVPQPAHRALYVAADALDWSE